MIRLKMLQATMAASVALAGLVVNEARADPSTCNAGNTYVLTAASNFDGTFELGTTGTTLHPDGGSGAFTCVQQQDKIFSDFSLGQLAPLTGHAFLDFATIDGVDTHSITFSAGYLQAGSPYTFGFNIEIDPTANPLPVLVQSVSDLIESAGQASLAESLTSNLGATYNIDFTKAATTYAGNTVADLNPGTEWLDVSDVLTLAAGGSNVSGVENSFVEEVPEPRSLLILGSGIIGLALLQRIRNRA